MKKFNTLLLFILLAFNIEAQVNGGLEKIIVETYYISDANDATQNSVGGVLPIGSKTYRIYADMKPGYKFQAAYGIPGHELKIATTTLFFNNEDRGDITPNFTKNQARNNTVMLDSWLSVGAACQAQFGVLKTQDDNVATNVNLDGVLQNNDPLAGIPITERDGYLPGAPTEVTLVGIDVPAAMLNNQNDGTNGPVFSTINGSWAALGGSASYNPDSNQVLIAQITTDGDLSFELNLQIAYENIIGIDTFNVVENYVAVNPGPTEFSIPSLIYPVANDTTTLSSTTTISICNNELPYLWNGNSYSQAGTFSVTLTGTGGVDSIATLILTVNLPTASSTPLTICNNDLPYFWNGQNLTTAGTFTAALTNVAGCDSIATLILSTADTLTSLTSFNICPGQLPFSWNGNTYSTAGTYDIGLTSTNGCDSIATLDLTLIDTLTSSVFDTVLTTALPYIWNGNNYNASGTYTVTLNSAFGCDSIVTLFLTVTNPVSISSVASASVKAYPNPSDNIISIDLVNAIGNSNFITLYDMRGIVILEQPFQPNTNGYLHETLDVNSLPAGMYMLRISSNGQSYSKQVIKR